MEKVRFSKSKNNTNKLGTGAPFFRTFNPKLELVEQLKKILQHLLYLDEVVKKSIQSPTHYFLPYC